MAQQTFNTPTSTTWQVPSGVSSITINISVEDI